MATLRKSTPGIVAVGVPNRENERDRSREVQQVPRHQAEEEVLPQQAALQTLPVVLHKVRKAELPGLRGKELEKVFKRPREV